jgi:hypothetical protein
MTWRLLRPDGPALAFAAGSDLRAGSAPACAVRLTMPGVPGELAALVRDGDEAWLQVFASEPQVGVNGRPVQALARLQVGDRVCLGALCLDLAGAEPQARASVAGIESFALRVRGGRGSGGLLHGPVLHLDREGAEVSAAAGAVGLILADGRLRLVPGEAQVRVNGHRVDADLVLQADDQLQVGPRRYQVEIIGTPAPESVTARLPAYAEAGDGSARGESGGSWWLIGIAAVIAAAVAALLYFHG